MRASIALAIAAIIAAGCSQFQTVPLEDTAPVRAGPASTTVWGDWLLATPADSTAFAGARLVELSLHPSDFTITASYPGRAPAVLAGAASLDEGGLLTLTPSADAQAAGTGGALGLAAGKPYSVLASAAGNTLLLARPRDGPGEPSSVWHRRESAKAAGTLPRTP